MALHIVAISAILGLNSAFAAVCHLEFEEAVCKDFAFSPEINLNSTANKLMIVDARGPITAQNLANLKAVTEVTVRNSTISEIEPGALCSSPNLTSISLVDNPTIPKIDKNTLKNCQRLKKLYLDGPEAAVENGAFAEVGNLQSLTLKEATLPSVLELATFQGLDSLRSLAIKYSRFDEIKEDAFNDLVNLKFLDLQSNGIKRLAPGTFRKLLELKVLNLADNRLKSLSWDEFRGLKSLRVLFLERNDFDSVDVKKLMDSVPGLERIFLSYDKLRPENIKEIDETLPKLNMTVIYTKRSAELIFQRRFRVIFEFNLCEGYGHGSLSVLFLVKPNETMAKEEEEDKLPDQDAAKEFYAKYEPKEILGRGISSTVRRCIEKETGKAFAAKIIDLSNDGGDGISAKEATKQEVAILRHVAGHHYIIELQDVFESPTFIFLVFELCKNGELFDYLTSVVTLSEKKTRYIMRQVLEGVAHIHSRGIVHRDLKPENILLDDNLNVKITDFGFAKKLAEGEQVHELCGTPGYLAPETLRCNMVEDAPGYSYEVDM
ncbi:phosphorylase b kinase gamma catalytic chain, skeletal muscle/heart isoform [Asbolus verrucosus]|uniref:Phosphorylase b kinase gamma catalytic chain, skeletal muscle/heart isoform n=1 Tax=Asbolus verrucosus TaxID=1661398 RepID=A0A482VJK9_ASBVE|nr:phosphorylase b kinase gamma catalytic chain, skeletal muscle/heart isoform [Asbolus verrucosus]